MTLMTKDQLLENLASYGYPLLMPKSNKAEDLLENLLEQDDHRFLEGFPVVLLNALQNTDRLEWEQADWNPSKYSEKTRTRLLHLLSLSCFLFNRYHVGNPYNSRALKLVNKFPNGRGVSQKAVEQFEHSEGGNFNGTDLNFERFKNTFETYVVQSFKTQEVDQQRNLYERELLLSQLFTARQKGLLRKKLEKQPLTKTEKEYFSRVVKKRLRALANEEVHKFARKLLYP